MRRQLQTMAGVTEQMSSPKLPLIRALNQALGPEMCYPLTLRTFLFTVPLFATGSAV